ncbi:MULTISPECIES: aromatic ring-hydroxylating oxygenase subunit alpha [Methylobacterium]|uniref:aromatic ring-hydroxylating oxygenase subunit alpha n=1 Tax=Methylobacterium TaxID=407 RepID=UPI0013EDF522|nr:SRPBCC family protein [Methylobacterium sp. DB0501]NGM37440.1 Rieske 2Fe-2S domain-containing protein [Methylobacterium sp. DB0501]
MSSHAPLDELLQAARRPFHDAVAMPPGVYKDEGFLRRELETIFAQEWMCVGRASALAAPGDYLTYELANQPIIVLRDQKGELRALSNVCLHRMSTLLEGSGRARSIVCSYHAWTYNLDGTLRGAPFMKETTGFCKEAYTLPQIRCEEWLGWIYVTLNPDAQSVRERFRPVEKLVGHYGMENYVECFRETHVWDTNWKVLAENFMESYHLPVCHAATVGPHSRLEEMICPPGLPDFNYHWITKEASLAIGNAHPDNVRLEGHWRKTTALLALYPSHLITLTPGYFWYLSLHPKGPGQVHITYGGGLSPEFMADPKAEDYVRDLKRLLDEVNLEDRGCTEKVYRGLNAAAAKAGHLSYLERPIYDFLQYIAARTGGFERAFQIAAE